jgi:uncharacterized membrane protein
MMGSMSLWMVLGLIVFLALVAGAVYLVLQLTTQRDDDDPGGQELLERRLASGEISPQEYAERQAALRGDPPAAT